MGMPLWLDPTMPPPTQPVPTVTVSAPVQTVTVSGPTVTEKVTVTQSPPSPQVSVTTATATVTPSPQSTPKTTKTVYRTRTPEPAANPAPLPTADSTARMPPLPEDVPTMPDGKVSLTPIPESSPPLQVVIEMPSSQPVSSGDPGAMQWAGFIVGTIFLFVVLYLIAVKVRASVKR